MRAAVMHEANRPLTIEDVSIESPRAGEVVVRIAASGVCRSDLHAWHGRTAFIKPPVVLGHEGAGTVVEVGPGVAGVAPGDPVVIALYGPCGQCGECRVGDVTRCWSETRVHNMHGRMPDGTTRLSLRGQVVTPMVGAGTLAELAVVREAQVVKIDRDIPLELACLAGCGVTTGVGAALNVADVRIGSSVVVIGCGGVGLNVIQGARIAGAARIIACDTQSEKLDLASDLGATDGLLVREGEDLVAAIKALVPGGVDYAFEVIGRPEVVRTVEWAGEPAKSVEVSADGAKLSPRRSFAIWKETVRGTATPWKTCEVEAVAALRRAVVEVVAHNVETVDRLNRSLRLRVAELDSFAYAASHDLREPLRGIHNYARFLVEDYADALDEEAVSRLETLVRLAKRMESLIEALLRYSRLGRNELSPEPTDLDALVASVLELLDHTVKERGARIAVRPLPTVDAHASVVGEIFANLITNALKYNDSAEPLVEIGHDPERGAFFVRDNGIGIETRHLKDVFRIFKRLHGRNEYGGGVGVGLTIVEKIVQWHGGRIWAESEPGEGTTFFFTLSEGHV